MRAGVMALIALGVNAANYAGFNALICSCVNTAKAEAFKEWIMATLIS
ncbi:MAG: hypothetical protein QX193_01335 [Methylococcales bacterium]